MSPTAVASNPQPTVALSFSDHMQAALFFDRIWPMHSMDITPGELHDLTLSIPLGDGEVSDVIGSLIMKMSNSKPHEVTLSGKEFVTLNLLQEKFYGKRARAFDSRFRRSDLFLWLRVIVGSLVYELLTLDGFDVVPMFDQYAQSKKFLSTGDWMLLDEQPRKLPNTSLQIKTNNLKLISTKNAEWDQIRQIREDPDSIKKIRNLRLLLEEKYQDKSSDFIADDIDKRIDLYEEAAKKHGFELQTHVVTSLLDPKSLIGVGSLAALASFAGGPAALTGAAAIGAVLHTSKGFFEVRQKKFTFASERKNSEVSYIVEAQKKLVVPKKWYQFWRRG
jgi:hypothetical protein